MLGAGKNTVEIIIAAKDRTKAAFAKVNTQMKTMKGSTGRLTGAMNGLKGGLSNVSSSLGSFGAALGPVGIALAAAAVVMATLGGAAIKASLEFEKAFATIRVGTGATGESLKGFEEDFHAIFGAIPSNAAAISQALTTMTTATGASGTVLQDLTKNIMEASRMLGEEGAGNAQAFGEAMKQWQIPAASGVGLMEQFFKIAQDTNIGFGELTGAMNAYGPVLQNAGFTAAESAELFGRLEGSGIAVSRVMPGLNAAFRKWAEEGIHGKVALEDTIGAIQNAKTNMEALTIATDIFGAEGAQRMTTAVRNGTFELASLGEMLEGTEGIIMKTSEATLTFGDKWTLLKNNISGAIAPIGDVIKNVLGGAMEVAINAFALAKENIAKFKSAVDPLVSLIKDFFDKLSGGHSIIQNLKDVVTVLWVGLKLLGDAVIWLIKNVISIFVKYISDAIKDLTDFYNKLGPLKTLIEGVKGVVDKGVDGFHNYAESLREVQKETGNLMERIDAVIEDLEGVENKAIEAPTAILKAWKLAADAFEEGVGSYKEAVSAIDAEIEKLKDQWKIASEEEKGYIEDSIRYLSDKKTALEEQDKVATEYFNNVINGTDKAIETTKDFIVTIGDTTIEFKGATAEVVKNADAYAKLQDSAQTLIDLDWSIFTEFEASLPNIEAGIDDMGSSFVGLKGILEDNIVELENVKQSVIDISEIAAPFLEAGFLDGIKAIGNFAGALSDAGSAINTFSSLQDVSIDGMVNFSMHVHDMVSALQILENQIADLEPLFGSFNSLIWDITENFVYSGDKIGIFTSNFSDFITGQVSDLNDLGIGYAETTAPMEKFFEFIEERGFAQLPEAESLAEMTNSLKYATQDFSDMGEIYQNMVAKGSFSWLSYSKDENAVRLYTKEVRNAADAIEVWEYATTMSSVRGAKSALITSEGTFQIKEYTRALGGNIRENQRWMESNYGVTVSTKEMYAVMQKPPEEQQKWFEEMLRSGPAITHQWNKQTAAIDANGKKLKQLTDAMQPQLEFMRTLNEIAALSTLSVDDLNSGLEAITNTLVNLGTALSTFDLRPVMESLFGYEITEGADIGKLTGGITKGFTDTMAKYQSEFGALIEYVSRLSFAISSLVNSFEALANISESVIADQTKLKKVFEDIVIIMSNFSAEMGTAGFADAIAKGMDEMLKSTALLITYFDKNNAAVLKFNNTLGMFKTTITNVVDTMDMMKKMSEMVVPSVDELGAGFDRATEFVTNFDDALMRSIGLARGDKAFTYDENGLVQSYENNVYDIEKMFDNIFTSITRFADDWARIKAEMGDSFTIFNDGVATITGIISGIESLVSAFTTLKDIAIPSSTDMEAVFTKIRDGIAAVTEALGSNVWIEVTTNLGLLKTKWDEISEGVEESLKSFSDVITIFSDIVDATKRLTDTFTDMEEIVVITADQIETAFEDMPANIDAVTEYLASLSFEILKSALKDLDTEWQKYAAEMEKSMESFNATIDTFSTLISKILELSSALKDMRDITVLSVRDIDEALKNIPIFLDRFVDALALNMGAIKQSLKELDVEWQKHAEEMKATMPSYEDSTSQIGKLVGSLLSLHTALESLSEIGTISERAFDRGFKSLMTSISNFAVSLSNNVDALIYSLQKLRVVWMENEAVLFPLIYDFAIITDNLWGVAHNANRMAEEFSNISKNSKTLENGFKSLIKFINQVAESTEKFYTTEAAAELAGFITDVGKVIEAFVDLERDLKEAMRKVEDAIDGAVNNMHEEISTLGNLPASARIHGLNTLQSFVNGLIEKEPALEAEMQNIADIIKGFLGVESPTKLGPLRDIEQWPRNLVQSYSSGIEAEMHTLNNSFAALVPNATSGVSSGNKNVNLYVTQNISDRDTADYANRGLERLLQRHEVM